ncbi:hypothetical protein [Celerinatantimonas sp. MCCC 1A17872]|uniref:hypothetical protein n=1 Tax=Celerinatantimonas sp. MCCC 1A17872 TaxID=3177514 RepID=UPI0038C94204
MGDKRHITIEVKGSKTPQFRQVREADVRRDVMENVRTSFSIEGSTVTDTNWKKMSHNINLLEKVI